MELSVSQFLPVALCSIVVCHRKESASINSTPSLQIVINSAECPLSPFFPMLNNPSALSLSSWEVLQALFIIFKIQLVLIKLQFQSSQFCSLSSPFSVFITAVYYCKLSPPAELFVVNGEVTPSSAMP